MNTDYPNIDADHIKRYFGPTYFSRGLDYWKRGNVVSLNVMALSNREYELSASVLGSEPEPYEVDINLKQGISGIWGFKSECSCPLGYDCKHVVASLLALNSIETKHEDKNDTGESALRKWLSAWQRTAESSQRINKRNHSEYGELHFVLNTDSYSKLFLELHYSKFKKNGTLGKSIRPHLTQLSTGYARPGWLCDTDALLLLALRHHLG
ncbi:MAG: hypothetical protein QG652_1020, partial [Pseudomonadota bacterium]|nr:hypothetical protein [Pseudomonadota bacterium]